MSYGIDFRADIFLNRQVYRNLQEVKDAIEECEDNIRASENIIKMIGASTIKDVVPDDWKCEPLTWVNSEINNALAEIKGESVKVYQLTLYVEYLMELEHKPEE